MLTPRSFSLSHHPVPQRRHRSRAAEAAFTLVEVLVCIAILGVVVIPISSAMVVGFRSTESSEAGLTASVNRDQLSERFTKDVAEVDAAGASTDTTRTCGSPASPNTLFVNFNRTRLSTAGVTTIDRVSYWAVGSGKNINVERFACTNVSATGSDPGGARSVVAKRLGTPGANRNDVVLAIYSAETADDGGMIGREPCTEFQCGIEISGRYKMQVTAQRRLFGAGVPVQAGKLYSSSATRGLNPSGAGSTTLTGGVQYEIYDITASPDADGRYQPIGNEALFDDKLSLAAGLDGPSKLDVKFAVFSETANRWLNSTGTAFDSGTKYDGWAQFAEAAAQHKVQGQYTNGVWQIPLKVGTNNPSDGDPGADIATYGGEYRIYTFLKPLAPVRLPEKTYGGKYGFPLWMDWRPQDSVFVKAGNPTTADYHGLNIQRATGSLKQGYEQARQYNRANIIVTTGDYNLSEPVELTDTSTAANRSLMGGHDPTTWLRGPAIVPDMEDPGRSGASGLRKV